MIVVGWSSGGHLSLTLGYTSLSHSIQPPNTIMALCCPADFEDAFWVQPNVPTGAEPGEDNLDDEFWTRGILDRPGTCSTVATGKRDLDGWLAPSDPRSRLLLNMDMRGRTLDILLGGLDKRTRPILKGGSVTGDNIRADSPLAQTRAGHYTTLTSIAHPQTDDLIPWQQSTRAYETSRAQEVDAELRIVDEGTPHMFDVHHRGRGHEAGMKAIQEGY
ncbi:hypothetical protein EKO27_g4156 [Xylaria grammica]|uniref:AB hydrolase-1 domain-containing protein n=1 Tax=Xylaria grammica TaxID=363999 RepID=A0A439D982_9PEZI|nr:hypothetical protein EKO27_g4156 [Xylaria grammica]